MATNYSSNDITMVKDAKTTIKKLESALWHSKAAMHQLGLTAGAFLLYTLNEKLRDEIAKYLVAVENKFK